MKQVLTRAAARPLRAACILVSLLAAAGFAVAAGTGTSGMASPNEQQGSLPAGSATNNVPPHGPKSPAPAQPKNPVKPLWTDLTPAQQQALAPLATEWDKLDEIRKAKWLTIGNKYASMKPDEQQRVHERMRDWVKLTPEQRHIARQSYARAKKLDSTQKTEKWEQYQQLPEEQKRKLAEDAAAKKRLATLPPASQTKNTTVPPLKSAPKPSLERPATPPGDQPGHQASPQPATK